MSRIPSLLTQAVLLVGIACGTAWAWLALTTSRVLSPGAVIVCTCIALALALAVEAVAGRVRRGRRRRPHARPHATGKALR
ncbi:hypothetical protein [Streptomyces leeuwenhoekii]|uniref:Sle1_067 protein n=1 Tax=Streptomyces leeuwenhoekii TaxID=1437453 RepID=A0A0F7VKJ9_STRLW|nr:hypothetical protein [Streptomyces leeuwenhoekii]CQR59234.1 sle1_067 [Streptomyces leeuwenhoekii]